MPIALSVNLNKVALLRNQRDIGYPSVVDTGRLVLGLGADGLTVHPRPDERHIRFADLDPLSRLVREEVGGTAEFNIEGYPDDRWVAAVEAIRPHQATLVPDAPDARTSDEGWDMQRHAAFLEPLIKRLKAAGCRVALFIDPDPAAPARARDLGADRVEIYTGGYAFAFGTDGQADAFKRHVDTAAAARDVGLGVNAGHDLNLQNLPAFAAACPYLHETSIGHALTADALLVGWKRAIAAYKVALDGTPVPLDPTA